MWLKFSRCCSWAYGASDMSGTASWGTFWTLIPWRWNTSCQHWCTFTLVCFIESFRGCLNQTIRSEVEQTGASSQFYDKFSTCDYGLEAHTKVVYIADARSDPPRMCALIHGWTSGPDVISRTSWRLYGTIQPIGKPLTSKHGVSTSLVVEPHFMVHQQKRRQICSFYQPYDQRRYIPHGRVAWWTYSNP